MPIRSVKLDQLYEYIKQHPGCSIKECIHYYQSISGIKHLVSAYKPLHILRDKGCIKIYKEGILVADK